MSQAEPILGMSRFSARLSSNQLGSAGSATLSRAVATLALAETQPSFQKWYVDGESLRPLAALSGGLRWPFWPFYFLRVFDVLLSLARPSPLSVRELLDLFNFKTLFVHRMDCN